jgi:hypothetical protein
MRFRSVDSTFGKLRHELFPCVQSLFLMRHRPGVLLAVCGWYLMVPQPGKWTPLFLQTNKPLSEWETRQSFDTAQECKDAQRKIEAFLDSEVSKRLKNAGSQKAYLNDPVANMLWAEEARIKTSKCIATDDPRLKGN